MGTLLLSIAVVGVAVLLLALRILLVRDGEFRGTCASNNPFFQNESGTCWTCGNAPTDSCEYRDRRSGRMRSYGEGPAGNPEDCASR